jgi:predicted extracellular nuclease
VRVYALSKTTTVSDVKAPTAKGSLFVVTLTWGDGDADNDSATATTGAAAAEEAAGEPAGAVQAAGSGTSRQVLRSSGGVQGDGARSGVSGGKLRAVSPSPGGGRSGGKRVRTFHLARGCSTFRSTACVLIGGCGRCRCVPCRRATSWPEIGG